ncbi:MAG: branched-chain amino acid ABC transporter permease [Desulfobacteraceae bacterium]
MNRDLKQRKKRLDRGIKVRSGDIFVLTSWREMLYVLVPRVLPMLFILFFILVATPYWKRVLVSMAMTGILALSWDLLVSTGLVSLGQALFFGMGAYVAGTLNHAWGWPYWATIPIATVGGGLICTLSLIPVLRLRGIYFAMITLVLPLVLVRIIEATKIFGGTEGLSGLSTFHNTAEELGISLLAFAAVLFGFRRLMGTDYGLVLQGIRDNDLSVISAGINIYWFKAQALFLAGSVGAFAGAFMTHAYMFVGMPVFALDYSILPIASAVVGGMGTLAGPALGACILVPLSEALRAMGPLRVVCYGLFLVVFTVAIPEGIFPYLQRKYHQFEYWVKVEA